jgi:hypothetical protein
MQYMQQPQFNTPQPQTQPPSQNSKNTNVEYTSPSSNMIPNMFYDPRMIYNMYQYGNQMQGMNYPMQQPMQQPMTQGKLAF